jgi:ATP-dependent DNA ligase
LFTKLCEDPARFFAQHKGPFIVEDKIDGEDLIVVRKVDGSAYALNRYNTIYNHLPFFDALPKTPFVIRGELYSPNGFYDLKTAIKQNRAHIMIHDILLWGEEDLRLLPLIERKRILQEQNFPHLINYTIVMTQEGVMERFEEAVQRGMEGIVVKPTYSRYQDNTWLKLKKKLTYDVLITAIKKENLRNGVAWSFKMEAYRDGKLVHLGDISSGFTYQQRIKLAKRPISDADREYIYFQQPIVAEVEALELNDKMRHPRLIRIRQDKKPEDCTIS